MGDTYGRGVLVGAVTPGGAAAKGGIQDGDTIESVHHSPCVLSALKGDWA